MKMYCTVASGAVTRSLTSSQVRGTSTVMPLPSRARPCESNTRIASGSNGWPSLSRM